MHRTQLDAPLVIFDGLGLIPVQIIGKGQRKNRVGMAAVQLDRLFVFLHRFLMLPVGIFQLSHLIVILGSQLPNPRDPLQAILRSLQIPFPPAAIHNQHGRFKTVASLALRLLEFLDRPVIILQRPQTAGPQITALLARARLAQPLQRLGILAQRKIPLTRLARLQGILLPLLAVLLDHRLQLLLKLFPIPRTAAHLQNQLL
ncbi:MAG: hypothetical protein BWY71_00560 [Planctomycetes bacterium ADurb.Bin412]|nr:MAG: hypothetical protein BWY71_00560 [Planctomycetes bacterium ADurb.Bin412]